MRLQLFSDLHVDVAPSKAVGATRVICSLRGYAAEKRAFDPALVVEVAP